MNGRLRNLCAAVGLLAAAATGCNRNAVRPNESGATPPGEQKSFPNVSNYFGQKPQAAVPGGPPERVVVKPKRKPGEGLKPETEVALANTEVESAFVDGRTAVERDQLLDSARQRFQRVLKKQPKHQDALLGLAALYSKAGDKDRAVATYKTVIEKYPNDHVLAHRLAATQAQYGDWPGAIEACRHALTLDPENRSYQKTMAFCLAQDGKTDEALATLTKLMPEAEARYFLGRILYDQDKPAEARAQMERAATLQYALANQFLAALNAGEAQPPVAPDAGIRTVGYETSATP